MNNSVRGTSFGLWLLSVAMGAGAAQAAPIRAHQPLVEPMLVHAGSAQRVRLTTFVNRGATQVARIEVYEHDERDQPTRYIGQLNDQGVAGDLRANDQWYASTLEVEFATPGLRRYSVALTIEGERDTLWSTATTLEAMPREVVLGATPPRFERELIDPETEATLACDGLLVYYAKGMPYAEIDAQAANVGARVTGVAALSDANAWNLSIPCADFAALTDLQRRLAGLPGVETVEPQARVYLFDVPFNDPDVINNGPESPGRWVQHFGHSRAWNITKGVRNFSPVVAIVDSGANYLHEELIGRVTLGKDFVGTNDFDPMDTHGHGTQSTALVGALTNNGIGIAGGAPQAGLLAIRVQGAVIGTIDHICDGIEYATTQGANIVNVSLGTTLRSRRLAEVVDRAVDAGMLVVAAAGNRLKERREYPAAFNDTEYFGVGNRIEYRPHTLAVGAIAVDGKLAEFPSTIEPGSNYGSWVDVSAYGLAVAPTLGTSEYETGNGTSVGTPMVSAAAALVWSTNGLLNGDEVRDLIVSTAQPTGFRDPRNNVLKRLNAFAATVKAVVTICTNCANAPKARVDAAPFPSPGVRIGLGFTQTAVPALRWFDAQPPSVHGFAIPLLPRLGSLVHAYEVSFRSDLRTFDAYNAQGGFFDLFAMTLGPRYFDQPLVDDVRPQLNSYFTAGGAFRIDSSVPIQVGNNTIQTVGSASSVPFLNVVLDTRAPAQVDAQFPSWGTVTIEDITPPRFE